MYRDPPTATTVAPAMVHATILFSEYHAETRSRKDELAAAAESAASLTAAVALLAGAIERCGMAYCDG
jgi:hypothetical protein